MNVADMAPKYTYIVQHFIDKIKSGELKDGDKLPTENVLCSYFNVSRITVRKALNILLYEGYIIKKHGKGSYVNTGIAKMQLNSLQGFTEEMKNRGMTVASKVLNVSIVNADNIVANRLQIEEDSKVYCIERLRLVDGEPMSIEKVYIPYYLCADIEKYDLSGSLYDILEKNYNLSPKKAEQCIEATTGTKREQEILKIKLRASVLKIERTTYLQNNIPLEYVTSIYRGDKYKFYVTIYK
ncbi:MAG TPA: phosphonate metabolism transcriptional regulator PhnF [Firmicutes bacterium]|nr:phosphonate metabolism transcriptional regulator PhnF [Bacillota bacterium]